MASEAMILQIVELVNPEPSDQERCRKEVIDCIRGVYIDEWPGVTKKKLDKVAANVTRARDAIKELSSASKDKLRAAEFLVELDRFKKKSNDLASKTKVVHWRVIAAAQTRIAAKLAFQLITYYGNYFGDAVPTLTDDGKYFKLTGLLFKAITGKRGMDVEHACSEYLKELERDGLYPNAAGRRQMRRARPSEWIFQTDQTDE